MDNRPRRFNFRRRRICRASRQRRSFKKNFRRFSAPSLGRSVLLRGNNGISRKALTFCLSVVFEILLKFIENMYKLPFKRQK